MRFVTGTSLFVSLGLVVAGCADSGSGGSALAGWGDDGAPPVEGSEGGATSSSGASGSSSGSPSVDGGRTSTSSGSGGGSAADGATPAPDSGAPGTDGAASDDDGQASGAGTAPVIGGCQILPADNPWNTRIDDTTQFPVNAMSDTYIAGMSPGTHLHPDWGDWTPDYYGIPWQTVPGSQAMVPITFQYADESDPGPYPFPSSALVEGGSGSGGDMHVLVIDTGTCTLYETWDSTYVGPGWSCGSGAVFNLGSNALRPDGWTSADAAGLPVLPGLVKVSEVMAGAINHAMRFTISSSQQGYIHPATHAAGSSDTTLPPMGLRLRLKASFDLSPFSGPALVILTAMKQYGLMLADNGSDWYVTGDSDNAWTPLMDGISQAFSQVLGSDFEAVDTGPISTAGL
jgi:hypothetical protein